MLPIAMQNLMTALVSASDALMLGFLNQTALSAVSLATQVQFALNLFFAALTIGTTVLAAQYWGKRDAGAVERILAIALRCSVLISLGFFVTAFFAPELLMNIFTDVTELITAGIPYLKAVSWSYLFMGVTQVYLCVMKNSVALPQTPLPLLHRQQHFFLQYLPGNAVVKGSRRGVIAGVDTKTDHCACSPFSRFSAGTSPLLEKLPRTPLTKEVSFSKEYFCEMITASLTATFTGTSGS